MKGKLTKAPRVSEATVLRAVLDALALVPRVHCLRLNAGLTVLGQGKSKRVIRGCEPGTPDVLVLLPRGRSLWVEVKAPDGKLSDTQAAWHRRAMALGHDVVTVRSAWAAVESVRAELVK